MQPKPVLGLQSTKVSQMKYQRHTVHIDFIANIHFCFGLTLKELISVIKSDPEPISGSKMNFNDLHLWLHFVF